jgi:hypothetical protein
MILLRERSDLVAVASAGVDQAYVWPTIYAA